MACSILFGCNQYQTPLSDEAYIGFCLKLQEEFNSGDHLLSEYFYFKEFANRISGQMSAEGLPMRRIVNPDFFSSHVDTFTMSTTLLIFNRFYHGKTGKPYGVFYADVNGGRNYWDVELITHDGYAAIADFYDYSAGTFLSEIVGQNMAITNSYNSNRHVSYSYNPANIVSDLIRHSSKQEIESAWASYNLLSNDDKKKKLFEFFRIHLAMNSSDSVYFDVVDKMLQEKKRDPRFFYLHRSNYFMLKKEYTSAVEQLVKLHEYTGVGYYEIGELAMYSALAGKYEEALEGIDELLAMIPDEPFPYIQRMAVYYLMGERGKFDNSLVEAEVAYGLAGEDLWSEVTEEYNFLITLPQFDSLKAWVVTPNYTLN